jgi:hypothetical protein
MSKKRSPRNRPDYCLEMREVNSRGIQTFLYDRRLQDGQCIWPTCGGFSESINILEFISLLNGKMRKTMIFFCFEGGF